MGPCLRRDDGVDEERLPITDTAVIA